MHIKSLLKKQTTILTVTVILITLAIIGASYALFYTVASNPSDQVISVGDLNVTYNGGSAISISSIEPMTDAEAASQSNNLYTFNIANSGTVAYTYTITLEDDPDYQSGGTYYDANRVFLNHQYIRYSLNGSTAAALSSVTNGIIYSGTVNAGATDSFTLRLWVADAEEYNLPNEALGSEIHLSIVTDGQASGSFPDGWNTSVAGTLLNSIKLNNSISSTLTTPGQAISTSDEAVLASTTDDYGTSYYYRGAVTNNYVVFANMCWRIVRVTGDGSIKLILYNYNSTDCTDTSSSSAGFARYSGTTYNSAFNTSSDDNAYIGFMYGTTGSSTYAATHANTNSSTIKTNLDTWYSTYLSTYSSYLADTIWCNDKSMTSGTGYGTSTTYYAAWNRIYPASTAIPSLVCPNDANGGKLSKFTADDTTNGNGALTYKIGLLTIDEMAYAGGAYNVNNSTYYLIQNATGNSWWTMTPGLYSSNAATFDFEGRIWRLNSTTSEALRPAISLVSSTKVTGSGTASNPYVVTGY